MALRYVLRSFTESPWIAASTVLLVMGGASALVQSASKDGYEKEQKQRWSLTKQLQRDPRVGIVPRNQVADSSAPVRRSSPAQDAESLAAQHEKTQKEYMELRKAATGGK